VFNIAPCTVATARVIITILSRHILTSLLHSALNTKALHIFIGGDFGVYVVALKNQSQRHRQNKKRNCAYGDEYYGQSASHINRFARQNYNF
jgi:hypothetical protein